MSEIIEYKCPACGGAMEFDSKTQKMKCPYCDTVMDVENFEDIPSQQGGNRETSDSENWAAAGGERWQSGETEGMRIYSCESCGGEIVAEETTAASTCPFCGNRIVMKGQFAGDLKPDYIIPFKMDKKAAKAAYFKHLKGKDFLPKIFRKNNHIDEMKGVYVPFWVFDAEADADITYRAEQQRTWEKGDTEYTEHKNYELRRSGKLSFSHVPVDGSKKMDDDLMESIEPYDFADAVPFHPAYLAGYMADRYDVEANACIGRAKERMKKSTDLSFEETISGYQVVRPVQTRISVDRARYWYVLYPVWLLNTTWNGNQYVFAMNGQTGKMVGDLPMDKKEFWKYTVKRAAVIGLVLYAIQWILVLM